MRTIIIPSTKALHSRTRKWSIVESETTLAEGSITGTLAQAQSAAREARAKVPSIHASTRKQPPRPLRRNLRGLWGKCVFDAKP